MEQLTGKLRGGLGVLREIAVALGIDIALKGWWTKTIDSTHRGDVARVLVTMVAGGREADVRILLARLAEADRNNQPPTEDEVTRALHSFIPKKDEWRDNARITSVDWGQIEKAINAFSWLANLPPEEFLAAVNTAIHNPIRQQLGLVGHKLVEIAAGVGQVANTATVNEITRRLRDSRRSQNWLRPRRTR